MINLRNGKVRWTRLIHRKKTKEDNRKKEKGREDRAGQGRTGQDRTGPDKTGPDKTRDKTYAFIFHRWE